MKLNQHKNFSKIGYAKILNVMKSHKSGSESSDVKLLHSFFLGNWMTDISQVVDPVVYAKLAQFSKELKKEIKAEKQQCRDDPLSFVCIPISATGNDIIRLCDLAYDALVNNKSAYYLGNYLKRLGKVAGYLEFVRPHKETRLLPFAHYKKIFNTLFTQYAPSKHFDRPDGYFRPDNDFRRYKHVTLAVKYLAEIYTKVDIEWAAITCNNGVPSDPDKRAEWSLNLAWLGHAMHTTEDFFAHTIFTEKILEMGRDAGKWKGEKDPRNARKHDRRLRRYNGKNANAITTTGRVGNVPYETYIVGGTFDLVDTLFALDSMIAGHKTKKANQPPPTFEPNQAYKKLIQALESDRKITKKEASDIVPDADEEILNDIVFLYKASEAFRKANPLNIGIIRSLRLFVGAIAKMLSLFDFEWENIVAKYILKDYRKRFENAIRETLTDWIGANRLGCHTLLCKDDSTNLHFIHAANLAKRVDYYIMEVMLRWKKPKKIHGVRIAGGRKNRPQTKIDTPLYVDWLQLLNFFLCHPKFMKNDSSSKNVPFSWYDISNQVPQLKIGGSHGHRLSFVNKSEVEKRAKLELSKKILEVYNATAVVKHNSD